MCSSPCEITNACDNKDKENFKKKSAFSSSLIESILSMLISMLIQKLIIEVKKKVKEYIMLKAKQKFEKIKKRQSERHPKAAAIINKTTEYANAYKSSGILGIMQFASQQRAQNNY
jgi:mannitol-specific phosphotransferase system IIBC component